MFFWALTVSFVLLWITSECFKIRECDIATHNSDFTGSGGNGPNFYIATFG